MGKIRTRILGLEDVEKQQKEEQKRRSAQKSAKKAEKHKIRAQGLKGGERLTQVEVGEESIEKMEKAKKILEEKPHSAEATRGREKIKKIRKKVRGNNYKKAKKQVDPKKTYSIEEALKLLKKIKFAKFDETVELHLNVKKTGLKGEVEFPHSTGKSLRVKIVDDKVLASIEKGLIDFDLLVTHPQHMPKLAKFAKVLGPKGLMPNPKAGTISDKPEDAAKKFSQGMTRWKTESKTPLIHQLVGKVSFEDKVLVENVLAFLTSVGKGSITNAFLKTTMSPSIKLDPARL